MQIYKVGGAIRDKLLGLTIKDNDYVVVGATPEAMLEQGYQQVGQSFPVFLHPQSKDEYALARTERKIAEGYTGFSFDSRPTITLEEDLYRRDLTINAIAEDDNGVLIDPYGGQQDLDNKVLRHVSAHFVEDPLRVLRVARFAARYHGLGFRIANDTLTLMTQIASSGELQTLSPERIWQEMHSALCTDHAAVFFQTLRDTGALVQVMPEIDALFGVPQPAEHHPEIDCGVHTLMVLEQACKLSDEPLVRFAALTHDLGKATTSAEILPSHHGHENRGEKIAKKLCLRLHCPTSFADIAQLTAKYHTHIHRAFEIKPSTLLKTLMALDMLRRNERFKYILMACKADSRGRTGFESAPYPQYDYVLACAEAITALDQKTIISTVSEPSQIKQAIHDARLSAVKSVDKRAFSSA